MKPDEYQIMSQVEAGHWWYRGLRDAVRRCLNQPELHLPRQPNVLDAGCGTGEFLSFLDKALEPHYLGGFDLSPEALRHARGKVSCDLYQSDLRDPEIRQQGLDLIISMDVICVTGLQNALPGLLRIVSHLRPGGLFILNLPAFQWLYSSHDAAVNTTERYSIADVRALLNELGLQPVRLSYRVFLLFPAIVLMRLPSILRKSAREVEVRSDLFATTPTWLNSFFYSTLTIENRLLARGTQLPWGSSVFAVGRKL